MIVEIESLEVVLNAGKDAVKILDIPQWRVEEAEKVAILGPSGSGKTTFLYALAGLIPITGGKITVCEKSLGEMSEVQRDRFRSQHIGFVYQNFNLLQGFNALENVLIGMTFSPRKPDPKEAEHLLNEVGLSHRLRYHPSQLSSGEQQRVAVARALANRPKLLLADEPTASLHPVNKEDVLKLLLNMCDKYHCTLIVVTHEREVISHFDRTVAFLELNQTIQRPEEDRK